MRKTVRILGTHGVPANYGGFETAAENIALHLVRNGWRVIVYCQVDGKGAITFDNWNGIERVNVPIDTPGWLGTSKFDWITAKHACQTRDLCLTFGYNTAVFNIRQRWLGIPNIINMDGIEWSRARWGWMKQAILYANERIGCIIGTHLIADHPEIERHLLTRAPQRKVSTLTYGADPVLSAPVDVLTKFSLEPRRYMILIARSIPENSILEIVKGYSLAERGIPLVILGQYTPETDDYHRAVMGAASKEVRFVGAIYDSAVVKALRFHALCYVHGHTVGGTNPSLVESMGAGNAVIAHDNVYNRWVAQDGAVYFKDESQFAELAGQLIREGETVNRMQRASRMRFDEEFTWARVAGQYEDLLLKYAG